MTPRAVDYVIIGQGIAGSCLALQLIFRNKSVMVYDQPEFNHSSSVAAGMFNPVTGKMLAKSWQADLVFPYLHKFYIQAEDYLKEKFFFPASIYRPFASVEEQNEWMGRSTHASMKEYIAKIFPSSAFGKETNDPVGGVLLKHGGYVDTSRFIGAVRKLLTSIDSFREEKLDESQLQVDQSGISYRDLAANKIIYCGGVHDLKSQYFYWLPIKPLKGETLTIRMQAVEQIYNRGVYVVPASQAGEFRVGATYDFSLTEEVTETGKVELESKLRELICLPYSIIHQNWGIRPTTPDRRLMIGPHPSFPNVVIFNGLGTKGICLAPYFSGQLAGWLEDGGEISAEVNIQRFKSLYFEV